jgi:hypothetical protein
MTRIFSVPVALLFLQFAGTVGAQDAFVDLPFAGVSLAKPEGFEAAKRFDGIENKSARISIMAMQVKGAFADEAKAFQPNASLGNGVQIESRADLSIAGQAGCLMKGSQDLPTGKLKKWILLFGNSGGTQMITANLPQTADDAMVASIKEVLLKTKPFSGDRSDLLADLPYEVKSEKMKPTRWWYKALVFTKDAVYPTKNLNDPYLVVGMSFNNDFKRDAKEFLEGQVKQDRTQATWKLTTNTAIEVGGLKGREIVTEGKNAAGQLRYGYWAVLMDGDDFYLFQGALGIERAQEHVNNYAAIVRSFKLKETAK